MDPTIPTPTACSTVTSSSVSSQVPPPTPFQLLEVSLISAQDLATVSKSNMRTYCIAWINPNRKLTTRTDQQGHAYPTWNEKFMFRLDGRSLLSDDTALTVEIYAVSWFRDVLIGTVKVIVNDLLSPPNGTPLRNHPKSIRFVALQVRRASGSPQGILNMGVSLLDSTMRSMPLESKGFDNVVRNDDEYDPEDQKKESETKVSLWRSLSMGSEVNNEDYPRHGSMCNGSLVNGGSELCSDIGPSASIVAAELAMKSRPPKVEIKSSANQTRRHYGGNVEDTGSSILEDLTMEEAKAKGYRTRTANRERWRADNCGGVDDDDDQSDLSNANNRHSRRNSDGGLFSCFGNAYGIEFTIVCGASHHPGRDKSNNRSMSRRKKPSSETNSA